MPSLRAWKKYRRAVLTIIFGLCGVFTLFTVGRTIAFVGDPVDDKVEVGSAPELPAVDAMASAERLGRALQFPTVSSRSDEPEVAAAFTELGAYLERTYPRVHRSLRFETVGAHARLYRWQGSDASLEPMLLMAHLDVVAVEAGTEADWTHPPFSGTVADGYIWGRGALDDKLSVLATLEAVEHLLAAGYVPRRTVYLAFGHDEEVGGRDGAQRVAELLHERGEHLAFVLDEGGVMTDAQTAGTDGPVALIGLAEKGNATLELAVDLAHGGHSSMPPAQTAVGIVAEAVTRLEAHPMPAALRSPTDLMLAAIGPHMRSWGRRYALANLWCFESILVAVMQTESAANASLRTTTAVTVIEGGTQANVLPTRASAQVNFRIAPGDTIDDVVAHVERVVADPRVAISVLEGSREPTRVSDPESASFTALARTIREVYPGTIVAPYLTVAGTDARHFEDVAGEVYRFLPIPFGYEDRVRVHGADERVAVDDYAKAIEFYMALVRNG